MALSIADVNFIVAERGAIFAYDYRPTRKAADELAARLTNERGKLYEVGTVEEFDARVRRHYFDAFPLSEIRAEFYDEMLSCLPPMHRAGAMGFFMMEMTSGSLTSQFASYRGRYYGACVDLLDRATWITPEKIAALAPAEPLEWFPHKEGN